MQTIQKKNLDLQVQTIQKKKKRKQIRKKNDSKIDSLGNKSSDQRLNNDEVGIAEIYSIVDNIWGIKITTTGNNTNLGLV